MTDKKEKEVGGGEVSRYSRLLSSLKGEKEKYN
jgi:hypothetical protein